jgi:hypothetical protein
VRLAVLLVLIVLAAVGLGLIVWQASDLELRRALANGFAIVGALVLVFALGSWMRTGPLRREGLGARLAQEDERREYERMALGLVAVGLALFGAALLLG